jgi:hypothetical protein
MTTEFCGYPTVLNDPFSLCAQYVSAIQKAADYTLGRGLKQGMGRRKSIPCRWRMALLPALILIGPYRQRHGKEVCKHSIALVLYAIEHPEKPKERKPDLTLRKVHSEGERKSWRELSKELYG